MDMILSECLNAVHEMSKHGGFAPAQWVLSRHPRAPTTMGDEDECSASTCGRTDCFRCPVQIQRVRSAALRKAARVQGPYQVADRVSYRREAQAVEHGMQWSVGCRLTGFEKGETVLVKGLSTPAGSGLIQCQSALLSTAYVRVPRWSCSRTT